jgi:hypothetical protein
MSFLEQLHHSDRRWVPVSERRRFYDDGYGVEGFGGVVNALTLLLAFSATDSASYQDAPPTLPATVQGQNVKTVNGANGTTPTLVWQSGTVPQMLMGGRSGGPAFYLTDAQWKLVGGPTMWSPAADWSMSFTANPREDVGGTVKQWVSKASAGTGPWIFRTQTKRPEFLGLTGNVPPSIWDMVPVVPRGPMVATFEWVSAAGTLNIYVNKLLAARVVGSLPALDVVNDTYFGGALGGFNSTTQFNDFRYWSGRLGSTGVSTHVDAMMGTHFLGQCYITAWGDSLTDDTRAAWVLQVNTSLVLAGIHRPIINCGKGGQCLSNLAASLGNSMELQYPTRERALLPASTINSVFKGWEWVNELFVRWQAYNGGTTLDQAGADIIVAATIAAHQAVVQTARADGYKVCVTANMYDCVPTYVPLILKHSLNAALALLFPTPHPRVADVYLPSGSGPYSGDFMVDLLVQAHIGPDGSYTDTNYFVVDGIHPGPLAAAIVAVPFTALTTDWTTHPPVTFVLPAAVASADLTTNLGTHLALDGDTTDSSGQADNWTTSGTVTYQAGLSGQEAICAGAGIILHADAAKYRFFRVGSLGFEMALQVKENSFGGIPFLAQKSGEWAVRGGLNGGNGDVAYQGFAQDGVTEVFRIALATATFVNTKPQYVGWGVDTVNKIAWLCVDGSLSYTTYTGTLNTGTASNITIGGSGTAGQYANTQIGDARIWTTPLDLTTPAGRAAARFRTMAIRLSMALPAL